MTVGSINILGRDQAFCITNLDSNGKDYTLNFLMTVANEAQSPETRALAFGVLQQVVQAKGIVFEFGQFENARSPDEVNVKVDLNKGQPTVYKKIRKTFYSVGKAVREQAVREQLEASPEAQAAHKAKDVRAKARWLSDIKSRIFRDKKVFVSVVNEVNPASAEQLRALMIPVFAAIIHSRYKGKIVFPSSAEVHFHSLMKTKITEGPASSPVKGEEKSSAPFRNWDEVMQQFTVLIEEATTQDELKRIYRKMAKEVHPDKNSGDEENAEAVFKYLANILEKKLDRVFHVSPKPSAAKSEDSDWLQSWSYTAYSSADEATEALQRRAELVKARGEGDIGLVTTLISQNIKKLGLHDLSELLDITSKSEFVRQLLKLTAKGAIVPEAVTDEMIWRARPMIEKMYSARTLQKGELVHFRNGSMIVRTVILEPISETNPALEMMTPSESEPQFLKVTQEQLIRPDLDLEREPLQSGFEMNIGEIFELDLSDIALAIKKKTTATLYGVAGGQYAFAAHDVVHNNLKNMRGHGFLMGRDYAVDQLHAGKIRKITPSILFPKLQPEAVKLQRRDSTSPPARSSGKADLIEQLKGITTTMGPRRKNIIDGLVRISKISESDKSEVVLSLIEIVKNKEFRRLVRATAINVLGEIRDSRAEDVLIDLLNEKFMKSSYEKLHGPAAYALRKIGTTKAFGALIAVLGTKGVRDVAAEALLSQQPVDEKATGLLIEALNNKAGGPAGRSRAADILGTIGNPRAIEALIATLFHEEDVRVRDHAGVALINLAYKVFGFNGQKEEDLKYVLSVIDAVKADAVKPDKVNEAKENLSNKFKTAVDSIPAPRSGPPASSPVSMIVHNGKDIPILGRTIEDLILIQYPGGRALGVGISRWGGDGSISTHGMGNRDTLWKEIRPGETHFFDENSKRINTANPEGGFIDITLDEDGRVLTITNAIGRDITVHTSSPVMDRVQGRGGRVQLTNDERRTTKDEVGGIDLNPALLDLQIKRDGNGVPLPLPMQPIENMHIDGFLPVIINIVPIADLPLLLGLDLPPQDEAPVQLTYQELSLVVTPARERFHARKPKVFEVN